MMSFTRLLLQELGKKKGLGSRPSDEDRKKVWKKMEELETLLKVMWYANIGDSYCDAVGTRSDIYIKNVVNSRFYVWNPSIDWESKERKAKFTIEVSFDTSNEQNADVDRLDADDFTLIMFTIWHSWLEEWVPKCVGKVFGSETKFIEPDPADLDPYNTLQAQITFAV